MIEVKQLNFLPFTRELHVSPSGSDTEGNGSQEKPYATVEKGRDIATVGTLVIVHPGSYTITTTAVNGLAKALVGYYFHFGVTLTKASLGDMFNTTGLTNAFFIFGQGTFYKTVTNGYIFYIDNLHDIYLQGLHAESYTGTVLKVVQAQKIIVDFRKLYTLSTLGVTEDTVDIEGTILTSRINVLYIQNDTLTGRSVYIHDLFSEEIKINCERIGSLFGVIDLVIESVFNIESYIDIEVVYVNKVDLFGLNKIRFKGCCDEFDADLIGSLEFIGTINTSSELIDCVNAQLTGNVELYNLNGLGNYNITGNVNVLEVEDGLQKIRCDSVNLFEIETTQGEVFINKLNSYWDTTAINLLVDGNVIINAGTCVNQIVITGGILHYNGSFTVNNNTLSGECITLGGGILYITGRIKNTKTGSIANNVIQWNDGVLVLDGAVLIVDEPTAFPIICSIAGGSDIVILTKGFNTNIASPLVARAQVDIYTVSMIAATSLTLDDNTNPSETYTENDTVTYDTKAKLAQRMAALINAGGLAVTASQDTPGVDEYFYVTANVDGIPVDYSTLINLVFEVSVYNSTLMAPNPADGANFIIGDPTVI